MKSTCVSQHFDLKVLLLMWSSPAALLKVKLSASRALNVPKSLFSHAAYHLRTISSFAEFCPVNALALSGPGRATAPTSAHAPVANSFLCDTVILVIVRSPFMMLCFVSPFMMLCSGARDADADIRTGWYVTACNNSLDSMQSAPLAIARRSKRTQPAPDIFDPHIPNLRVLSVL